MAVADVINKQTSPYSLSLISIQMSHQINTTSIALHCTADVRINTACSLPQSVVDWHWISWQILFIFIKKRLLIDGWIGFD